MNDQTLVHLLAKALCDAALTPQTQYLGTNSDGTPCWGPQTSPFYDLLKTIGDELWKMDSFRERIMNQLRKPESIAKIAEGVVARVVELTAQRDHSIYPSGRTVIEPTVASAIQQALAERLSQHPELLPDTVVEETLRRSNVEVKLTPRRES